jgi:putative ABC transport system permease protein
MLRHFLMMAARSFVRHKLYGLINIAGLSVGLACAILITLFVRDEVSYDRWIADSENLYRLEVSFHPPGREPFRTAQTPFAAPRLFREQFPQVMAMTRMIPAPMTINIGDRQFAEKAVTMVDPNFLQVIKLPLVSGDPRQVLAQPQSMVITQSIARKYFGNANPIGKVVTLDTSFGSGAYPLTITGVLRDLPHNTQLQADILVPNTAQPDEFALASMEKRWTGTDGTYGYLVLAPGTDPQTLLARLPPILDRTMGSTAFGFPARASEIERFQLTPFWDTHLTSDQLGAMQPPGSWTTVYGFAFIAFLILLVACFNFMNLATARATLRAKEIALRKVSGGKRHQLMLQFLGEATLMALSSLVIALAIVEVVSPAYGRFLDRPLELHYLVEWRLSLMILVGTVITGVLGGLYPAFVLSSFRPATALKLSPTAQTGSGLIRMVLVVFQFAVSIALGIAAIVVFTQINFSRHKDMQFRREGILVVRGLRELSDSARESFARILRTNPQVAAVALSNAVPFDFFPVSNELVRRPEDSQGFTARIVCMKPEYPDLYDMPLIAGRLFSTKFGEDATGDNVLINALAARRLGLTPQTAVGEAVLYRRRPVRIAGVLGDSQVDGLKQTATPTLYRQCDERMQFASVRLRPGASSDTLAFIDQTWRAFAPNSAIQRYFLTDAFNDLFKADEKQGVMFGVFVGVAIFIACLGLFGLAVFTAARRTKEIGVRKVFGARPQHIVRLLLRQVSRPVVLANVIAWPVAYLYLRHWLENYPERIALNPMYFVIAGGTALLIACATVFAHARRLAGASPIHALRYE